MELLFQSVLDIPLDVIRFQGLVQLIVLSGIVIFKVMMPVPQKKKVHHKDR